MCQHAADTLLHATARIDAISGSKISSLNFRLAERAA
jgi:hypothetical protein